MQKTVKRIAFLERAMLLPVLAAVLNEAAAAQGTKAAKDAMQYQDKPNGSSQCSGCKFFMPGKDPAADGSCKIVDGTISPHGYCIAFSAK